VQKAPPKGKESIHSIPPSKDQQFLYLEKILTQKPREN